MIRILDLFCGAGGSAVGYYQAAQDLGIELEIVGVDLVPQKHYPFRFVQADAMAYPLVGFDFIHASPPCQGYSRSRYIQQRPHPLLLELTRRRLRESGAPWIMENVAEAPMPHFVMLCGTHFGLKVYRHRQFESSVLLFSPGACRHPAKLLPGYVCIYGDVVRGTATGNRNNRYQSYPVAIGRAAMGIDWMTQHELAQAIPPEYTRYLGRQMFTAMLAAQEMEVA